MNKYRVVSICVCLILFTSSGSYAQSNLNQKITGEVTDASGSALANAVITVTNQDTGLVRTTKTNSSGNFVVPEGQHPEAAYIVSAFMERLHGKPVAQFF